MDQPIGFANSDPTMVCKLKKAIYRLKHAPGAWFESLTQALKGFGFTLSICDSSLFTLVTPSYTIIMLVYMDDIIVSGNSSTHARQLINKPNA